jgi:DNA-binding HxlR family transcriptional regulator
MVSMTRNLATSSPPTFDDLSPEHAREAISAVFRGKEGREQLYEQLSAWVWSALRSRRSDPELREWLRIFKATQAQFSVAGEPALAERLQALVDLVYRSVRTADVATDTELLGRAHVRTVLRLLLANDGSAPRKFVRDKTGLLQGNLNRVVELLESAGLVTRHAVGREVDYELTRQGKQLAKMAEPQPRPASAANVAADKALLEKVAKVLVEADLGTAVTRRRHYAPPEYTVWSISKAIPSSRGFEKSYTRGDADLHTRAELAAGEA